VALAACDEDAAQTSAVDSRAATPAPPRAETVRECETAVYGELRPAARRNAITVGPLSLLVADSDRRAWFEPAGVAKVLVLVRSGETVTVVVPEDERRRLSMLYAFEPGPMRPLRFADGTPSVRFSACRPGEEWGERPYPDPRETQFNGGFFVRGAQCATLDVWVDGVAERSRLELGFGRGGRPCPAEINDV
jgi:hypothetical protein